jgi:phage protein D
MRPIYRVTVNGNDITTALTPLLLSISVQDGSGTESDRLELQLADATGSMEWPEQGAVINVALGYETGINAGLTDMGDFVVDEVEVSNPPRQIIVRGNAIDLRADSQAKTRQRMHYEDETVETLVGQLAAEMGYGSAVHPRLAPLEVPAFDRDAESPMSAVTRLARRFDAVATVKRGTLGFVPAGVGETASGAPIPPIELAETVCTRWRFSVTDRLKYQAVEARYHDFALGEDVWVKVGDDADGANTYQLRQTYPDRTSAQAAAEAKFSSLGRNAGSAEITTVGYPIIGAQVPIILVDFGAGIDGRWIADDVTHRIDNSGFQTTIRSKLPAE